MSASVATPKLRFGSLAKLLVLTKTKPAFPSSAPQVESSTVCSLTPASTNAFAALQTPTKYDHRRTTLTDSKKPESASLYRESSSLKSLENIDHLLSALSELQRSNFFADLQSIQKIKRLKLANGEVL